MPFIVLFIALPSCSPRRAAHLPGMPRAREHCKNLPRAPSLVHDIDNHTALGIAPSVPALAHTGTLPRLMQRVDVCMWRWNVPIESTGCCSR